MKNARRFFGMAALAAFAIALTACGAVTETPAEFTPQAVVLNPDGTGSVGKGDVQIAFGWNNAAMQRNYRDVSFEYDLTVEYGFECEWWNGPDHNRKYHKNSRTATTGVKGVLVFDQKVKNQFVGWTLKGFDGGVPRQPAEPTDSNCGEGKTIVVGSVDVLSSSGGLYAVHNTNRELLE